MKHKVLAYDESVGLALALQEESTFSQLLGNDTFSSLLRKALQKTSGDVSFALTACSSQSPRGLKKPITTRIDFFTFNGFAGVFSQAATDLIVSFGIDRSDFLSCQIKQIPHQNYFFFVPRRNYDVLDIKKSVFQSFIAASPPEIEEDVMSGIKKLVLRASKTELPSCFLLKYPSTRKMEFPEIIVSSTLSQAWLKQGMTGAKFFA